VGASKVGSSLGVPRVSDLLCSTDFEWHGDRLRTAAIRPAVIRHPRTGEWSWFNQALHWHTACLSAEATLEELGQRYADPPMTKDAVAGRIRRLLQLADRTPDPSTTASTARPMSGKSEH